MRILPLRRTGTWVLVGVILFSAGPPVGAREGLALPVDALALARRALDDRAGDTALPEALRASALWDVGRANVHTSTSLLRLSALADRAPHAIAIEAARIGIRHEARTLSIEIPPAPAIETGSPPSALVNELARRHGVPTPVEAAALDALPPIEREALALVLSAFIRFETETALAYALVGPRLSEDLPASALGARAAHAAGPLAARAALGVDLSRALAAREAFLDAALRFASVWGDGQGLAGARCAEVLAPPAIILDLGGCNSTHVADAALLVDVGGDDVYLNNAGGSSLDGGVCGVESGGVAAALVDLAGDDRRISGRDCGVNGGGRLGVGLLLDLGGNDIYVAGAHGTNGGGTRGAGLLVDVGGNDAYDSRYAGTNGAGERGLGALVDVGGNDRYSAWGGGGNGGASQGAGFLLDVGGDDRYHMGSFGVNGGAEAGTGFLMDTSGNDRYLANLSANVSREIGLDVLGFKGANGGGTFDGVGFLFDAAGDDRYSATRAGTNGGGYNAGLGLLIDGGGSDSYLAEGLGSNGGGFIGAGFLVDAAGNDRYRATGAEELRGWGFNGGAYLGSGYLLDVAGDDHYLAGSRAVNGGALGGCVPPAPCPFPDAGAVGVLFDLGGEDRYEDEDGGRGRDRTVVPKGTFGAQLDLSVAPRVGAFARSGPPL